MLSFAMDGTRLILINERGETQRAMDNGVAVLLSVAPECIVLHKIGDPDMVMSVQRAWQQAGESLGKLVVINLPRNTSAEELNNIWHNTGYIVKFLKDRGVNLDEVTNAHI